MIITMGDFAWDVKKYHEDDNDRVKVEHVSYPGWEQNELPKWETDNIIKLNLLVEQELEFQAIEKINKRKELREMRCDIAREFQQEALQELSLQRGIR